MRNSFRFTYPCYLYKQKKIIIKRMYRLNQVFLNANFNFYSQILTFRNHYLSKLKFYPGDRNTDNN